MTTNNDTTKINIQVNQARAALDTLSRDFANVLSEKDKKELIATIRLTIEILEHKALRIQELEAQVANLKQVQVERTLNGDVELIQEIAALDRRIVEYENTIQHLQEMFGVPVDNTGT